MQGTGRDVLRKQMPFGYFLLYTKISSYFVRVNWESWRFIFLVALLMYKFNPWKKLKKKGELWIGEWNTLWIWIKFDIRKTPFSPCFQQNMPSEWITVLHRTIRLLIQQPKVSCHHRSSLFNYIIFYHTGNKSRLFMCQEQKQSSCWRLQKSRMM